MAQKGDNRTQFKLYKEDVQRRGKPFFPYAMFHDTVMSFVVVCVIIALAAIWYFTSGKEPGDSGVLGPRYAAQADPGTTQFIPRPDWYSYFLFYLLRIFKWPNTVILGTIGVPTLGFRLLLRLPAVAARAPRPPRPPAPPPRGRAPAGAARGASSAAPSRSSPPSSSSCRWACSPTR